MPSPIGHSLAGYAAAHFTRIRITRDERLLFAFGAAFGVLPDVIGQAIRYFSDESAHAFAHSFAALALVSVAAAALATTRGFRFWPVLALVAAAYGSHLLADLLRPELRPLDGEQLFWPLPGSYGIAVDIFPHIPSPSEYGSALGYALGLGGIALREALILGPIAVLAHFVPPRIPARSAARANPTPATHLEPEGE